MSEEDVKPLKLENEHLREELHKLTLKLDSLRKTHSTELDFLREEHEHEKKTLQQNLTKLHEEYKSREFLKSEKNAALTEEINSLREEHEQALEQVEKFRTQVDILKNAKSAGAASSYSDYEGLKESNKTLRGQLAEKVELLTDQTEKISRLDREVIGLRGVVAELNEIGEGKDSMIKELSGRVKELEREKDEETGALQNEVLILKDEIKRLTPGGGEEIRGGGGGTSRGNSLFSEVEERRLKVEGELQRLRDLVKRLTAENRSLQLELERGDTHSASITTQLEVISKSEDDLMMEMKKEKSEMLQLIDSYRDRFTYICDNYTRKLEEYRVLTQKTGFPPASFTELETLRQDRDSLQFVKLSLERENFDLKRELKYNKHLRTQADANVKILKAKLEFAKNPQKPKLDNGVQPELNDNVPSPVNMNMSVLENTGTPNRRPLISKVNERPEQCNQQ